LFYHLLLKYIALVIKTRGLPFSNHANDISSNNVDGHEANITTEQQKLAAAAKTNNVEIATTTT